MLRIGAIDLASRKFGSLRIETPEDVTYGSGKKAWWVCNCGKRVFSQIRYVLNGHTKSCGRCNLISAEEISKMRFGKFRIETPQDLPFRSAKRIAWVCDCGKRKFIVAHVVLSGGSTSCGKCDLITKEEISYQKFGKLSMVTPEDVTPGSGRKVLWKCDCGNTISKSVCSVLKGTTPSCNRCTIISSAQISEMEFGKLRIKTPKDVFPGSGQKTVWKCDCGREKEIIINSVIHGVARSCGSCNTISALEMTGRKFGRLRIKTPEDLKSYSNRKVWWVCDCGGSKYIRVVSVFKGDTKSCGNCFSVARKWYDENCDALRALSIPINVEDFPNGGPVPLENITEAGKPFRVQCFLCQNVYRPRFLDIKRGISITCGCTSSPISTQQRQIAGLINQRGYTTVFEYPVGKRKFDIYVPEKNLLIEYHGLKWHSSEKTKKQDFGKYELAQKHGYGFISIFSDEWEQSRDFVTSRIELQLSDLVPNQFIVSRIGNNQIQVYYIVVNGEKQSEIIFTNLSQNKWSLSWGYCRISQKFVLESTIQKFRVDHSNGLIQFIGNNRYDSSTIYQGFGFRLEKEIQPEKFWCSSRRRSKDPATLTGKLSEIWDLGKKLWILSF